ncbi:hypothetical protein [Diplocloster agilis]|uniref:Uncharacterized protein n=1 Tax=Diplocloster agilis TaxID=2850323 RepID=A0A949NHW9_9FIRM|nr:hypothetical protein [Diplocloster agilis]MBU9738963.1 hypothetical protein [Diplocloster agilis]
MSNQIHTNQDIQNMEELKEGICLRIHNFLVMKSEDGNPDDLKNKMREDFKIRLRWALKECGGGNAQARNLVREYIRKILLDDYKIRSDTLDKLILFQEPANLTVLDRFEILLYQFHLESGTEGLEKLLRRCSPEYYSRRDKEYFDITAQDIDKIFLKERVSLNYMDKLQILTQRIFEESLGWGCADVLGHMRISGLMAGTVPGEEKIHVWAETKGRTFRFPFLQMEPKELETICKRIRKSIEDGSGRFLKELPDHTSITVKGPPDGEDWMFFIHRADYFLSEK